MNNQKTLAKTLENIDSWKASLNEYDFDQLLKKPSSESWSIGQVYMHLINSTLGFHLKQMDACLQSDANHSEKKTFEGFLAYRILGGFPPIKIKVPPSELYTPKQPESKEQIASGLEEVEEALKKRLPLLAQAKYQGKTQHPGLGYMNAREWFQLVEMHFRHHLRQKSRLDDFLNNG